MKKVLLTMLTLFVAVLAQAQTINEGDKFWDGYQLWTVQEVRMNKYVYMTSSEWSEKTLEKVDGKPGWFTFQPSRQADESPLFGCKVQYMRDDSGVKFLVFRNSKGDAAEVLLFTEDDEEQCKKNQEPIEDGNLADYVNNTLLNEALLGGVGSKAELRLLRNKILAFHGYRFQSKDLQQYFGRQPWYKPGNNNAAIKLSPIEQTNLELIKSEEAKIISCEN